MRWAWKWPSCMTYPTGGRRPRGLNAGLGIGQVYWATRPSGIASGKIPRLTVTCASFLIRFRQHALARLSTEQESLDFGLIHADLVPENVMRAEDGTLYMIDFDDGGFGFRLFDIATALIKHRVEPDFTDLRAALIEGYQSQRTLDVGGLEFFMALRAVTYVGWIITRMGEDGARARNKRFLAQAKALISAF